MSKEKMGVMDAFSAWVEKNLMPPMMKIVAEPHFAAVRDGLAGAMGLVIVGSIFLIAAFPPYEPWDVAIEAIGRGMVAAPFAYGFGLYSIYVCLGVSYALAKTKGLDPLQPMFSSLITFLLVCAAADWWGSLEIGYLGALGLITAILIANISVEIFDFCVKGKITIRLPPQVPPAITESFVAVIPIAVTVTAFWTVRGILGVDIVQTIIHAFSPILAATDTLPAVLTAEFVHIFCWSFGIHGDMTIETVLGPMWATFLAENVEAVAAGLPPPHIYTSLFRSFVVPGGSGCTLPLAFYCAFLAKSAKLRQVGKVAIPPGFFNINEPVTFGVPIFLNPVMWIPFWTVTIIAAGGTFQLMAMGLINKTWVSPPWTLFSPLLLYLACGYDIRASIWVIFTEFIFPAIVYYPFFRIWDRHEFEAEQAELKAKKK